MHINQKKKQTNSADIAEIVSSIVSIFEDEADGVITLPIGSKQNALAGE